jgi:hypothetical protein
VIMYVQGETSREELNLSAGGRGGERGRGGEGERGERGGEEH